MPTISDLTFTQELELFRQKIVYFFGLFVDFVRQVIAEPSMLKSIDLILICAAALVVVLFLIGGLIRFFTEPWKKKLHILLTTLLILLILAAAAFFLLRLVPLPQP